MSNNTMNLLPEARQRALAREYYMRISVVALLLVTSLALVSMVLLVPMSILLANTAREKEAHLAALQSELALSEESALALRLQVLSDEMAKLSALANAPSASETIRSVLFVPHLGVKLSGFSYAPALGKSPGNVELNGVAATRDELRTYQLALARAPSVRGVNLPVSAFAKDSDIPFTIDLTLAP
jgi:hypothetical protein